MGHLTAPSGPLTRRGIVLPSSARNNIHANELECKECCMLLTEEDGATDNPVVFLAVRSFTGLLDEFVHFFQRPGSMGWLFRREALHDGRQRQGGFRVLGFPFKSPERFVSLL